ncbi:uncharacterized protein LOC114330188 [Diabrotica virgifera virgifera]|uniref:Uncharacterized protein LOC114330188 n=1 Tax=Diabrotica virgifera virgifera TaxID=50390 RepID=A0A6P7FQZ0_DIAVI|nr:uncharacterized protein LOC114330188 [Diabrotica virgifera virgifera]XP_050502827.1 uncharacterized protein LOC114330188 [Diabrotica virgifera virgifera]
MHMWSILVPLILIFYYCDSYTETEEYRKQCAEAAPKKILCGNRLSGTMNLVCAGRYYDKNYPHEQRTDKSILYGDYDPNAGPVSSTFSSRSSLRSLLVGRIRSHGAVNECCYRPCGPATIIEYCQDEMGPNDSYCRWIEHASQWFQPDHN